MRADDERSVVVTLAQLQVAYERLAELTKDEKYTSTALGVRIAAQSILKDMKDYDNRVRICRDRLSGVAADIQTEAGATNLFPVRIDQTTEEVAIYDAPLG